MKTNRQPSSYKTNAKTLITLAFALLLLEVVKGNIIGHPELNAFSPKQVNRVRFVNTQMDDSSTPVTVSIPVDTRAGQAALKAFETFDSLSLEQNQQLLALLEERVDRIKKDINVAKDTKNRFLKIMIDSFGGNQTTKETAVENRKLTKDQNGKTSPNETPNNTSNNTRNRTVKPNSTRRIKKSDSSVKGSNESGRNRDNPRRKQRARKPPRKRKIRNTKLPEP